MISKEDILHYVIPDPDMDDEDYSDWLGYLGDFLKANRDDLITYLKTMDDLQEENKPSPLDCPTEEVPRQAVHLNHCYQGEYEGSCKYGYTNCPAKPKKERKRLIYNAIKTPDGTVICSRHRHDFVQHTQEDGRTYCVDGGLDYTRVLHSDMEWVDMSMYDDEPHSVQRDVLQWGTYGKDGKQAYKLKAISDMSDKHIEAVLEDCWNTMYPVIKDCMINELEYRDNEGIVIEDE